MGCRMTGEQNQDELMYSVVVNHEEQYSIWPTDRECPAGWRKEGKAGSKAACSAYIKEVWVDMRPLSVRKRLTKGSSGAGSPGVQGAD